MSMQNILRFSIIYVTLLFFFYAHDSLSLIAFGISCLLVLLSLFVDIRQKELKEKIIAEAKRVTDDLSKEIRDMKDKVEALTFRSHR